MDNGHILSCKLEPVSGQLLSTRIGLLKFYKFAKLGKYCITKITKINIKYCDKSENIIEYSGEWWD